MYLPFPILLALIMLVVTTLAIPVTEPSSQNVTVAHIDKRITHAGLGTRFHPRRGRCGERNTDEDPVVHIALEFYNKNYGDNCGQWMKIINTENSNCAWAYVSGDCLSCDYSDLDISPAVFSQLADLDKRVIPIEWQFMPKGWKPSQT